MSSELVKHGRGDLTGNLADGNARGTVRLAQSERGERRVSRTNDTSPFYGGGRTRTLFPTYVLLCTTGFYINSTTYGTVMVTAGHCSEGNNGKKVNNGNDTASLGSTEGVHLPDPDLGLIDGSDYAAATFGAGDQTTWKSVTESANPAIGVTYCQYGATSLRRCYQYASLTEHFCDTAGCTYSLAYAYGPSGPGGSLGSGGDSGGGVFRELTSTTVGARGIVIARGCDATQCEAWDHKRQTILSTFSATVVTR
jgi:hypothetical protein